MRWRRPVTFGSPWTKPGSACRRSSWGYPLWWRPPFCLAWWDGAGPGRCCCWGETFGASEALAWGLVERVVSEQDLDAGVETWLSALLSAEPEAVALQKALIRKWEDLPMKAAINAGIDAFEAAWSTEAPGREMARFQRERAERRKG